MSRLFLTDNGATEVLIRPMSDQDVAGVVGVHLKAFPTFFLAELGPAFLRELYHSFLQAPVVALVAVVKATGQVCAVVAGPVQPARFFSRLLARRWWVFGLAALPTVLRRPGLVFRLLRAIRYRGESPSEPGGALLSSIAVDPEVQGRGIGKCLTRAFLRESRQRGARYVYLLTDAENEDVNRFYQSLGFEWHQELVTPEGRHMYCYVYRFVSREVEQQVLP